jgi:pimeloyl-ACP methyl ester carboxylesterase
MQILLEPSVKSLIQALFDRTEAESDSKLDIEPCKDKKKLLLFVHGFLGGQGTWGIFPQLIQEDTELSKKYDVAEFNYETTLGTLSFFRRNPKIQELSDALMTWIDHQEYDNIDILCHSMGGLLVKRYLTKLIKHNTKLKTSHVMLIAVPNNGADLARIAGSISWSNYHLKQLCKAADFLDFVNEDWKVCKMHDNVTVRYVTGDQDMIVSRSSAFHDAEHYMCATIDGVDHKSIVKPKSCGDLIFKVTKKFLLS